MNRRISRGNVRKKEVEKIQNCWEKKKNENENTTNVVLVRVSSVSVERIRKQSTILLFKQGKMSGILAVKRNRVFPFEGH
jgi:hypothetical protein